MVFNLLLDVLSVILAFVLVVWLVSFAVYTVTKSIFSNKKNKHESAKKWFVLTERIKIASLKNDSLEQMCKNDVLNKCWLIQCRAVTVILLLKYKQRYQTFGTYTGYSRCTLRYICRYFVYFTVCKGTQTQIKSI